MSAEPNSPMRAPRKPHVHRAVESLIGRDPGQTTVVQVCSCGAVRAVQPFRDNVTPWCGSGGLEP